MGWVADISRPVPPTRDVKVAGAPMAGHGATTVEYVADQVPAGYDGAATGLDQGETAYLPGYEGEATRDDLAPVRGPGTARRRKKRRRHPARRSGGRLKVLGVAVAMSVAGGAAGGWVLMSGLGQKGAAKPTPAAQTHGPPPLTDAQRRAAEARRLRELKSRAARAARSDGSRPTLFAKGTPPVTKKPETKSPETKSPDPPDLGGPAPVGEAQRIAKAMLPDYGWSPSSQFGCLVDLWNKESGWNTHATNPSTGAYGIPQALPGSKMATAGSDWQDSARTQIKWGLGYIRDRYGTPCAAWQHSQSTGWY